MSSQQRPMSIESNDKKQLEIIFNRILSRCDTLHDFDGERVKVPDKKQFGLVIREAMEQLNDLKNDKLCKDLQTILQMDPEMFDIMKKRLHKILNGKTIDLAYTRLENGISNKQSYELSVIRFLEHYINQTKLIHLPKLIVDYDNTFKQYTIDLKSRALTKGETTLQKIRDVKNLGDQIVVQIKYVNKQSNKKSTDDEYDPKHKHHPNMLPEVIYNFFRRTTETGDETNPKEYIKLILDTTNYNINYFESPLQSSQGKKVEIYTLYSSLFDAASRKKGEEGVEWDPSVPLADRTISDKTPIFKLCKLNFENDFKNNIVKVKAIVDDCSKDSQFCKESCKDDMNSVNKSKDTRTSCPFYVDEVGYYPVSVAKIADKVYEELLLPKKPIINEKEKHSCLNKKFSEYKEKAKYDMLKYDKINILLDLKRAGDGCQIIETSLVNRTRNQNNLNDYETAVFVTIDHLAFMKARMLNIPVIFQKKRSVPEGEHTEFWFVKPPNYHYNVDNSFMKLNNVENTKQKKTALEVKTQVIKEKIEILTNSIENILKDNRDKDGKKPSDLKYIVKKVLNKIQGLVTEEFFEAKLLGAYSGYYKVKNNSQNTPIANILKNHYVHCELKLYVAGYLKDISMLLSRLLIFENLNTLMINYQKSINKSLSKEPILTVVKNQIRKLFKSLVSKRDDDINDEFLDTLLIKLNDIQDVFDSKNFAFLGEQRILDVLYKYFDHLSQELEPEYVSATSSTDYSKCYKVIFEKFFLNIKNEDTKLVKKFFPISSDTRILNLMNAINMSVMSKSSPRLKDLNILKNKTELWEYAKKLSSDYDNLQNSIIGKSVKTTTEMQYLEMFDIISKDARLDAIEKSQNINLIDDFTHILKPFITHVKKTIDIASFSSKSGGGNPTNSSSKMTEATRLGPNKRALESPEASRGKSKITRVTQKPLHAKSETQVQGPRRNAQYVQEHPLQSKNSGQASVKGPSPSNKNSHPSINKDEDNFKYLEQSTIDGDSFTGSKLCDYIFIMRMFEFYHDKANISTSPSSSSRISVENYIRNKTTLYLINDSSFAENLETLINNEFSKPIKKSASALSQQGGGQSFTNVLTSIINNNRRDIPNVVVVFFIYLVANSLMAFSQTHQTAEKMYIITMNTAILAFLLIVFIENLQVYVSCVIIYLIFVGLILLESL
jgi:hypothetical protein